jgi:hypothetical protein
MLNSRNRVVCGSMMTMPSGDGETNTPWEPTVAKRCARCRPIDDAMADLAASFRSKNRIVANHSAEASSKSHAAGFRLETNEPFDASCVETMVKRRNTISIWETGREYYATRQDY